MTQIELSRLSVEYGFNNIRKIYFSGRKQKWVIKYKKYKLKDDSFETIEDLLDFLIADGQG